MPNSKTGKRLRIAARIADTDTFDPIGDVWLEGDTLKIRPVKGKAVRLRKFLDFYRTRGAGRDMDDAAFFRTLPSRISYQIGSCAWVRGDTNDTSAD